MVKATVKNPRSSVEKLSPKESVEGGDTALRGSVRALKGFSKGKTEGVPEGTFSKPFQRFFIVIETILTLQ